jgi:hypothetical protein
MGTAVLRSLVLLLMTVLSSTAPGLVWTEPAVLLLSVPGNIYNCRRSSCMAVLLRLSIIWMGLGILGFLRLPWFERYSTQPLSCL